MPGLYGVGGGGEDIDEVVVQHPILLGGEREVVEARGDRVFPAQCGEVDRVGEEVIGLVTGAAGFIGAHLTKKLLANGHTVIGVDNLNDYYDVRLKHHRLAWFEGNSAFTFVQADISDRGTMDKLAKEHGAIYVSSFLGGMSGRSVREVLALMQDDRLHPNAEGVKANVEAIGPAVLELVERARR